MSTPELAWIGLARSKIGQAEIPGPASNEWIARLWIGADWLYAQLGRDDSRAPWCGAFIRWCVQMTPAYVGLMPPPKDWYRAKAWATWAYPSVALTYGALVVFERAGGGHVGWCVGRDERGLPMILGGNQRDRVSIAPFDPARISAIRLPVLGPVSRTLPRLASNGAPLSTNEA